MRAPLRFSPMPLDALDEPFDHDDSIFELKYDGFRALAYIEAGACRLVSRKRTQYKSFPQLPNSDRVFSFSQKRLLRAFFACTRQHMCGLRPPRGEALRITFK